LGVHLPVFGSLDIPAIIGVMIPVIALMIPVVAILTRHQQQMATIIHRSQPALPSAEIEALRQEIQSLKEIVHQQAIALDGPVRLSASPPPAPDVARRLIES
jgi:hypothetical protein